MNKQVKEVMMPKVLVTNDDGIDARGIRALVEALTPLADVYVVAPSEEQSGKSQSITFQRTITAEKRDIKGTAAAYAIDGTPADCAKLGINIYLHEGRLPDLLVSGINHGSNASAASIYSGTLGATAEGTLYDIPSVGLSINTHAEDPDFEGTLFYGRKVIDWVLADGLKRGIYLNVNVPAIPMDQIRGIRMARQGLGRWVREFDHRVTLRGKHYFWMVGDFEDEEPVGSPDADHHLVDSGYVSIVPHRVDTTDYEELERLRDNWKLDR